MINIEILGESFPTDKYDAFLKRDSRSTIYHTLEWKKVVERNFGYKSTYLVACNENGICGLLPLFFVKNVYGKRLDSLPQTPYGGPIGERESTQVLISKAIEIMDTLDCKLLLIRSSQYWEKIFDSLNFGRFQRWYNQFIKIDLPATMWDNLSKTNKSNIRRAMDYNLTFEASSSKECLEEFYRLFRLTYKRLGFPILPYKFFEDIWSTMNPSGYLKLFVARYKGIPISSTLNFTFKDTVFSAFHGWDDKWKYLKANNFLDWFSLVWCHKNGFKKFDFGLTSRENMGLYNYKSSFNSISQPYFQYCFPKKSTYIKSFDLVKKVGNIVLKRLPISINERCGLFLNKFFV
ncbi:MAG: GNAT family N-acetyltransferase [Thermoplasmata archaeon]|nr:GNAT family N-acetyltransferase [Thermoplasmata archaeon]